MNIVTISKLQDILLGTVRPLIEDMGDLNIFSGIQVGQNVLAADGSTDVLPLIAGTNIGISISQNGITFTPTIASAPDIRTAIDAVRP